MQMVMIRINVQQKKAGKLRLFLEIKNINHLL